MGADAFISGWLAGAAGVVVSHPLDTLRVRVQAAKSSTLRQEAARLLAEDGWRGLWRGIASPILLVGLWKAVMFSAASWTQRMLSSNEGEALAPISHTFAGGYVAGAAGLVVQMPMERVKCVAQARGPQYIASSSTQAEIAQGAPRQQILESHAGTSSRFNGLSTRARATSFRSISFRQRWRSRRVFGVPRGSPACTAARSSTRPYARQPSPSGLERVSTCCGGLTSGLWQERIRRRGGRAWPFSWHVVG